MIEALIPQFVVVVPARLEEKVLYICEKYKTALHKCCCGCGREVVTPLGPAGWSIQRDGLTVTLYPSISNFGSTCKSHYWVRRNKIVWAQALSQREVSRVRLRDQRDRVAHIKAVNRQKDQQAELESIAQVPTDRARPLFNRLLSAIVMWLKT